MDELTAHRTHYEALILQYATNASEDVLYQCSELGKQLAKIGVSSDEVVHFHHEAISTVASQLNKQAIVDVHDMLTELALHQKLALEREINAHQMMMLEVERKKVIEQSILSAFPDTIIKLSLDLQLLDVNKHFFKLFGQSTLTKVQLPSLFQFPDVVLAAIKKTLASGVRNTVTENLILADGQLCPSEISMLLLMDGQFEKDGILLIIRDLRESIESEKRVIMAKQMVFDVIETIPQRIYWIATNGKMVGCNSYFLKDIGHTSLEEALADLQLTFRFKHLFLDQTIARNILSNQLPAFESERSVTNASGDTLIIHEKALPLKTHTGELYGVICCYDDVTKIKQEQAKNERLTHQLNQSQRLESIGKLSGSIAHDFNNMLSVIMGYSQLLVRHLPKSKTQECDYLSRIITASEKAKHLTAKLLSFSKRDIQKLEIIELTQYIKEALSTYQAIIGEDTRINFIANEECFVKADITQLDQVVLNLLVNARDAMAENDCDTEKRIVVTVSLSHDKQEAANQTVMIRVEDSGCGIERDKLQYIFEPFYSTKEELGTGLGLATIYGIIEQHNAEIQVTSQLGQGTVFSIYWPLHNVAANPIERINERHAQPMQCKKTSGIVYVVEDEPGVRMLMQSLLIDAGYQVSVFENGSQLFKALPEKDRVPDLLITDLILSEQRNGKQIGEKFNHYFPTVPILYVSGYSHELVSKHGIVLREVHFLKKPFEIESFISIVSELIT